jgi:AcrR family transcriptional regulator
MTKTYTFFGGLSMYSGNNPTAIKSQRWLTETLIELMEEKPYEDISIMDICKKADLSRQTFYNFFDSKDELFRYLLKSIYIEKLNSLKEIPSSNEAISAFVSVVRENPRIVNAIVKNNMGNLVSDEIFNAITNFLNRFIPNFDHQPDFSYHIVLLSGALTHFMLYYARNNEELSEKEMTKILETFLSGKIFKLIRASKYLKKIIK